MIRRRLLITAGPTHEPIDAVRYLANRSSGAMGIALAEAGRDAGHDVTLLLGPISHPVPTDVNVIRFQTTQNLQDLLDEHFSTNDVLIMAAAVADYRPKAGAAGKIERGADGLVLELESTPDLVARCAAAKRDDQMVIGFALEEPAALAERAQRKLSRKRLDAIIANPLETMSAADIEATIYTAAGEKHEPGPMSKQEFARWVVGWLDKHL